MFGPELFEHPPQICVCVLCKRVRAMDITELRAFLKKCEGCGGSAVLDMARVRLIELENT